MSSVIEFFALNGATITFAIAVALLFAMVLAWSRHRIVGALGALAGTVLLGGVWLYGFDDNRVAELRAVISAEQKQNADLRDDLDIAQARRDDLGDELRAALKVHSDQLARLHRRADEIGRRYGAAVIEPTAGSDTSPIDWSARAPVSIENNNRRYTAARQQIERLNAALERATAARATPPAPGPDIEDARELRAEIKELRKSLAYGIKTENYDVDVLPDNELVNGQAGRYYVIDLKHAASGLKFRFPGGQYTLARSSAPFRKALTAFVADVAGKLEGEVDYGFFVRGSADSVPFRGRQVDEYRYNEVKYLKSVGQGRYRLGALVHPVRASIRNRDLPFLRARFLKDVVASTYPVSTPVILEGTITDRASNADRNVELILYVDW
ncbi:MAG: hypothetical protein AAFZ01_09805 [Pseudomonadota bacterium]